VPAVPILGAPRSLDWRRGAVNLGRMQARHLNRWLLGATNASPAQAVLEIFCPNLNEYHILAWHLGAALASVAGGVAIGGIAGYSGRNRSRRTP